MYPYVSRIVEITNDNDLNIFKTKIELIPMITLHKNDELYQGCVFTKDEISVFISHIQLMHAQLMIDKLDFKKNNKMCYDNGFCYKDEILYMPITEKYIITRLDMWYKLSKMQHNAPRVFMSATPMNTESMDLNNLLGLIHKNEP